LALTPGTRLGVYEVTAQIGVGGMGEVYQAIDTNLKRQVAIKVLPAAVAGDADRLARFQREAEVLAALNHPNIAAIYGLEKTPDFTALIMELVDGDDLSQRIARGPVPLDEALPIAKQIAEALETAHDQGIIHRDLKPANIKVRADGMVKVLDFGLAKAMDPAGASSANAMNSPTLSMHATKAGIILGTAAYMSPEQAAGKPVDKRSDLWAFGVVVLEMLTGRPVFTGETVSHVLASVLKVEPDWSTVPETTPAPLRRLLRRCLEKDRKRRIADASDARLEVEDALTGATANADTGAPKEIARTRFLIASSLAAFFGVVAVAVSVLYLRAGRHDDTRPIALSWEAPDGTTLTAFAVSPDGRSLAFTAAAASTGETTLWIRGFDSLNPHRLPGTDGASRPFWSPDSRNVAYSVQRGLFRVAASGGPPKMICECNADRGGTWGRSGVILFTPSSTTGIFRVDANGGSSAPLTHLDAARHETSHRFPFFLPDGDHYLFAIRSTQPDARGVYVGSLESVARLRLVEDSTNAAYAASRSAGYLVFARGRTLLAQLFDPSRNAVTGEPSVVAENVQFNPASSKAEFSVAEHDVLVYDSVERGQGTQVMWLDRSGVRGPSLGEYATGHVSLSPDDTRVVLNSLDPETGTFKLWMVDIARGVSSRLRPGVNDAEATPVMSPDGTRIAFTVGRTLMERSSAIGGEEAVLLKLDQPVEVADWSRDGRYLMYMKTDPKTKSDLWILPMSANAVREAFPFAHGEASERNGAFSPDGNWIAYDSDESGVREIYVQKFSESATSRDGKWQVSKGGGEVPHWRRDGKELFYMSGDASALMAVPISTGSTLEVGVARPLFRSRMQTGNTLTFAVAGDGRRFLIPIPVASEGSRPATVVFNWIGH
jgi:eukaryotic-like serine/threonine-protein kinase